jgi:hypothetical protein
MTRLLLLALAWLHASAAAADDPWFKLVESKSGGYIAGGKLNGSSWGFRLPGREIKQAGGSGPPAFMVDGVVISLVPVRPEDYGRNEPDPLKAQAKYEQDYFRKTFPNAKFTQQELCKGASLPHGSWIAEVPPRPDPGNLKDYKATPHQAYLTFQVADVVLMTTLAYGDENAKAAAEKIDSICRTFMRDKP